jgi:hypothetical protein
MSRGLGHTITVRSYFVTGLVIKPNLLLPQTSYSGKPLTPANLLLRKPLTPGNPSLTVSFFDKRGYIYAGFPYLVRGLLVGILMQKKISAYRKGWRDQFSKTTSTVTISSPRPSRMRCSYLSFSIISSKIILATYLDLRTAKLDMRQVYT